MKFSKLINFAIFSEFTSGSILQNELGKPLNIAISVTAGSNSHVKYLFEISEKLAIRGHSITYICAEDMVKFSKGYNVSHKIFTNVDSNLLDTETKPFTRFSNPKFSQAFKIKIAQIYEQSFPRYESYYKEEKPDLIICDFFSPGCIESAAKYSIPLIIGYQSLSFAEKKPYLTISNGLEPTTIESYTFWDRFNHGLIDPIKVLLGLYGTLSNLNQARKSHGMPEKIELTQFKNMGLGIANSYIGFENPRSLPSHVFPIGPILSDELSPLSNELNDFLNTHKKVLYIAFGSLIKFEPELSQNILEHFQRLIDEGWIDGVIWGGMKNTNLNDFPQSYTLNGIEYSTDRILKGEHENFMLLKWAPQDSILSHPNVKLFMTHCGLDSIYEAIQSGTPMLAMPFFGDQPRNAMLIKEHGIGDYIEWPLDGDALIHQKMVNLLDPENSRLKSNLEQFQRISKFSSGRKMFAADLIETYAYQARTCRRSHTPKSFEIPCEVKPFLPLDHQISTVEANLIDVYIAGIVILLAIVGLIGFVIAKRLTKLYKNFNKLKKD